MKKLNKCSSELLIFTYTYLFVIPIPEATPHKTVHAYAKQKLHEIFIGKNGFFAYTNLGNSSGNHIVSCIHFEVARLAIQSKSYSINISREKLLFRLHRPRMFFEKSYRRLYTLQSARISNSRQELFNKQMYVRGAYVRRM